MSVFAIVFDRLPLGSNPCTSRVVPGVVRKSIRKAQLQSGQTGLPTGAGAYEHAALANNLIEIQRL